MTALAHTLRARLAGQGGFTLIEILVAMTVMMFVFGATLTVYNGVNNDHRAIERHNDAQQAVRQAMERMTRELRNLAAPSDFTSPVGTYPASVEKNDKYDFIYKAVQDLNTAPAGNPVGVQRIRYCLDASDPARGRLYRQTQSAAAFTLTPPLSDACPGGAGWTSTTLVSENLVNRIGGQDRPLFRYSTAGALLPYNAPEAITDTTRVSVQAFVDPTPSARPKEAALSSGSLLRNQNRRPIAKFTVTVAGRTVELNAGESEDPESERLTYSWYEDGVLKTAWSEMVVRVTYTSPGTHTYKLVVRDPAGLDAASETQTVVLP